MSQADSRAGSPAQRWLGRIRGPIRRIPRRRLMLWGFLAVFLVYLSNDRVVGGIDSRPSSLLPVAVLVKGSLTFDGMIDGLGGGTEPNGFRRTAHGLVSYYPIATGLLAVPFYAPVVGVMALVSSPSSEDWVRFAWNFQKLPAAVFAALAVLVFWRLCEAAEFPPALCLGLTLWFAFGSELFSVGAQTLWQHGPGTLAMVAAMNAQLRLRQRPSFGGALALSTFCALAVAIRLPNVMFAGPFGLIGLRQNPRLWLPLFLPALILLGLWLAYNLYFFGGVLGNYGWATGRIQASTWETGLPGLLWSPGRGLIVYFSACALAGVALALRPRTFANPTGAAAAVAVVAAFLFYAGYDVWWAGWCYGPRYLSEIEPAILLLLGLAWRGMAERLQRGFLIAIFALLPLGILVQAVGVYSPAAFAWNYVPADIDHASWRLWDVADNPILRGLGLGNPVSR
jgi:hypothetical protein